MGEYLCSTNTPLNIQCVQSFTEKSAVYSGGTAGPPARPAQSSDVQRSRQKGKQFTPGHRTGSPTKAQRSPSSSPSFSQQQRGGRRREHVKILAGTWRPPPMQELGQAGRIGDGEKPRVGSSPTVHERYRTRCGPVRRGGLVSSPFCVSTGVSSWLTLIFLRICLITNPVTISF